MKSSAARRILWTAAVLAGCSALAEGQPCVSSTGRQVSVAGAAVITVHPDRVAFAVGVETEAPNVSEAFRKNSSKVNAVIAALKQHGVTQQEIQTSNLSIESRDENGKRLPGFRVANLVSVTRENPLAVGELLQAAVAAGANQAGSLRFFVADPGKLMPRGIEMAYQNARAKAEKLATLSGKALGEVVCISDTSANYSAYGFMAQNIAVTANSPEIAVGEQSLSFEVSVTFELR
jgi:uncharacterized protein YggE